jgi:excisionase family DNA binding protein
MIGLLLKLIPKRRRVLAEVAGVGLVETVFEIKPASRKTANLSITHKSLLPPRKAGRYLTTGEAHEETGISRRKLQRLAREERIEAIKVAARWLILKESLYRYISEHEED